MKELHIQDCQLVTGGVAPALIWAATGVATYLGTKIYSGEDITFVGAASSAIGGVLGGGVATVVRVSSSLRPIVGGFAGGASEGFINNTYEGIRNSKSSYSNKNQSGSDYGDGCDYQ